MPWVSIAVIIAARLPGPDVTRTMVRIRFFAFVAALVRRFREEHFGQLAASLAFTTLLSLVPLVTVMLSVVAVFPFFSTLVDKLDAFLVANVLPAKAGGAIAKYTLQFSQKASRLTSIGVAIVVVTAGMLLGSIERAFNHVWRVRKPRPLVQRLQLYGVIVFLGPVIVGLMIAVVSSAVTVSLGFIDEPGWLRSAMFKVMAELILCLFFAFLYYAVPNARVRLIHALIGGVFATAAFTAMQRILEAYLSSFPGYTLIYGAFATLPIFLVWLYLSWAMILVGALVTALLPQYFKPRLNSGANR